MECESFRERAGADPADTSADLAEHERTCSSCAAYVARLRKTERMIQKALRFDGRSIQPPLTPDQDTRAFLWPGAAALAIALIGGWFAVDTLRPITTDELVAEVAAHWNHDLGSFVPSTVAVSDATLERALDGRVELDLEEIGMVSYARLCRVAGQWMPHLVVQSSSGPVTVLLMPDQYVESAMPVALPAEGIGGQLMPSGRGAIAVLSDDAASLEWAESQIGDAITWTI
jgi:hypothetical protein